MYCIYSNISNIFLLLYYENIASCIFNTKSINQRVLRRLSKVCGKSKEYDKHFRKEKKNNRFNDNCHKKCAQKRMNWRTIWWMVACGEPQRSIVFVLNNLFSLFLYFCSNFSCAHARARRTLCIWNLRISFVLFFVILDWASSRHRLATPRLRNTQNAIRNNNNHDALTDALYTQKRPLFRLFLISK